MLFVFFNDPATTEIYTLSLHDALPIYRAILRVIPSSNGTVGRVVFRGKISHDEVLSEMRAHHAVLVPSRRDRKSTRLNSSHSQISYAVFCLKKIVDRPIHGVRRRLPCA